MEGETRSPLLLCVLVALRESAAYRRKTGQTRMEFRQLRSFLAVARSLNFSRAAVELHLSQPALSAQIKALEDDLGTQLLERNKRTVRLTRAGESFRAD